MTQAQTLTFTNRTTSPFRYDIVGSFLRPAELKAAREKFANKEITKDELKAVEDKAIKELVEKESKAGLHAVTDGEFRPGALKVFCTHIRNTVTSSMVRKPVLNLRRLKEKSVLTVRIQIWRLLSI